MSQKNMTDKTRTRGKSTAGSAFMATTPLSPMSGSPHRSPPKSKETIDESALTQILARFDQMEKSMNVNIGEVRTATKETASEVARLSGLLNDSRMEREADRRTLHICKHDLMRAQQANHQLAERINDLENRSKIYNLRIDGKTEDESEKLIVYMTGLIEYLGVEGVTGSDIEAINRIGKKALGRPDSQNGARQKHRQATMKPRTIMVTFRSVQVRNAVFYARTKLNKSDRFPGIYLNDDVTLGTRKKRDEFRSVATLARTMGSDVRVHGDGIIIDGQKFRHNDILPEKYSLAQAKTVELLGELYFHSEHSFLSNFYPSPINDENEVYQTAEHLLQATKCRLANDTIKLNQVMTAQTPLDAKRIADQIPETAEWRHGREALLTSIINKKFDQNPDLADMLLATGNRKLNEATNNTYYGIGATLHSKALRDRAYSGLNKLGEVLVSKRNKLREAKSQD